MTLGRGQQVIRRGLSCLMAGLSICLASCATTAPAGEAASVVAYDPWERWNRKVYSFNGAIDAAVLQPVATVYERVLPAPVRTGVNNFYANVADLWSAFNNVLQGKFSYGLQNVLRVGTNTLFGVAGVFDVASDLGLDRHDEDFGQTLGWWGLAPGPYFVWPLLGPSTVRDSLAMPLDRSFSPSLLVESDAARLGLNGLGLLNQRANLLPATRLLENIALDKYSFVRDAYMQRRRSLVYDGNEPELKEPAAEVLAPVPSDAASSPEPQ